VTPFVNPVTTTDSGPGTHSTVIFPGLLITVYPVIDTLPAGGRDHVTIALPSPAIALWIAGDPGDGVLSPVKG
jgi:hypothetical protein